MAKKKHAEEHENLERWLVSYADFMTLLFATFVVLYALAQSDVNSFKGIEEALRKAFQQNIFDNQSSIMDGKDSILNGEDGSTSPIMLEYMSQKYEQESYKELKEKVDKIDEAGVSAEVDERGLVIRLNEQALQFYPGSADLTPKSYKTLEKIAKLIREKFAIHYIQVEGHTDSDPITTEKYASNWELSASRASSVIRYMIHSQNFNPKIFIATGLADTIPVVANTTAENKAKNRRVEIIILKNKNKHLSKKNMEQILKEAQIYENKKSANSEHSEAVEELIRGDSELLKNVIDMTDRYENETKRLNSMENDESFVLDGQKPDFIKK